MDLLSMMTYITYILVSLWFLFNLLLVQAFRDYYDILEVDKDASTKEVKTSFRKLALKYHPDKYEGDVKEAEKMFREIVKAYQTLSDPDKREHYDRLGRFEHQYSSEATDESFEFNYEEFYKHFDEEMKKISDDIQKAAQIQFDPEDSAQDRHQKVLDQHHRIAEHHQRIHKLHEQMARHQQHTGEGMEKGTCKTITEKIPGGETTHTICNS